MHASRQNPNFKCLVVTLDSPKEFLSNISKSMQLLELKMWQFKQLPMQVYYLLVCPFNAKYFDTQFWEWFNFFIPTVLILLWKRPIHLQHIHKKTIKLMNSYGLSNPNILGNVKARNSVQCFVREVKLRKYIRLRQGYSSLNYLSEITLEQYSWNPFWQGSTYLLPALHSQQN